MIYTVYTKENCPLCDQAKSVLNQNKIEYEEIVIGKDITREQVLEKFPHATLVPIILSDDGFEVPKDKFEMWIGFEVIRRRMNVK